MKHFIFLFIALFLFIFPIHVKAIEEWTIDNFQSEITIQPNGKIEVTETIDTNFESLQKHGIYRDIPNIYYFDNGSNFYADIQVESINQNGLPTPVKQYTQGNFLRLQIGNAQKLVSGKVKYQIKYLVTGVLRSFENHDELYWDVTGNGWPVPINKASATINLPQNGITGALCFEGVLQSTEKCTSQVLSQNQARFQSSRILAPSEGMTIILGYTKGMVPILTVSAPKVTYNYTSSSTYQLSSPNLLALLTFLALGLGLSYWLWAKNGRDLWWKRNTPGANNLDTVVVEYSAPQHLRPAEVGTILDEKADTLDVSATIVDLAARGFLTITEQNKKWAFGSNDYILDKKDKDTTRLLGYEKILLNRIFAKSETVKISELKNEFYDDLVLIKKALYRDILDKKYFAEDPEKIRKKYLIISFIVLILGISGIFVGIFEPSGIIQGAGWGLMISGIVLIILSQAMPRRTNFGHETYLKILGFKMFIEKAEKYRQQFFERENIFNEVLPYAVVFGSTEKFAQAFKNLGLKPANPTWYISLRPFNPVLFSSNINSFSNSLTSSIASQPRSNSFASSGSGFSSGGGFSGGGFGGGGGGSW